MRVYVSGGMTGWPNNNEDAFDDAEQYLLGLGHRVTTPVELGRQDGEDLSGDGFNATDEEYEGYLQRDLDLITAENFDAIVFVRGWSFSGGAGREGRKAIEQGLRLFLLVDLIHEKHALIEIDPDWFLNQSRTARLTQEEVAA